jgi:chromosome segregation ATPase
MSALIDEGKTKEELYATVAHLRQSKHLAVQQIEELQASNSGLAAELDALRAELEEARKESNWTPAEAEQLRLTTLKVAKLKEEVEEAKKDSALAAEKLHRATAEMKSIRRYAADLLKANYKDGKVEWQEVVTALFDTLGVPMTVEAEWTAVITVTGTMQVDLSDDLGYYEGLTFDVSAAEGEVDTVDTESFTFAAS